MNIPCQLNFPNVTLGRSKYTVSRWGCVASCLSMLSELFGEYYDVPTIAGRNWYDLYGQLFWRNTKFKTFRFVQRVKARNDGFVRGVLDNPNGGVMLNVWVGKHWVLALKPVQTKRGTDFLCADPLTGKTCLAAMTYGSIDGCASFEKMV